METPFRAIQPMHWAGMSKVPGGPMVCGACPTPEACDAADRCARASDEDYRHMPEWFAVMHVRAAVRDEGAHDVTGCPRFCRAICKYKQTILTMQAEGRWPDDLMGT